MYISLHFIAEGFLQEMQLWLCHTNPILFVRESLLDVLVQQSESLAQGYGTVGGGLGDGVHQLSKVGLEVCGALLDHVRLRLRPVEPSAPARGDRHSGKGQEAPPHRPRLAPERARHLAQESTARPHGQAAWHKIYTDNLFMSLTDPSAAEYLGKFSQHSANHCYLQYTQAQTNRKILRRQSHKVQYKMIIKTTIKTTIKLIRSVTFRKCDNTGHSLSIQYFT